MNSAHILISGGGIGGLSAALALLRFGFRVDVFEASPTLGEIGAGLTLAPNAMQAMRYLGIEDRILEQAVPPVRQRLLHWQDGHVIRQLDRTDMERKHGAPYVYAHRADVHMILVDAVRAAGGRIHTGAAVRSATAGDSNVTIELADGRTVSGDLAVGADGIRSPLRQLFAADRPQFTGQVAYRAVVPVDDSLAEFAAEPGNFIGPRRHVVFYPLRKGSLLNLVFFNRQGGWEEDGWSIPARRSELEGTFDGWHEGVQQMIAHVREDHLFKWAINTRLPLDRWSIGDRITLLGDAAHAMTPFLGQGAASAIEDGVVLARALHASDSLAEGLARYEKARRGYVSMIQLESNAIAERLQNENAEKFGTAKLRNEETLGLFDYNCGTVAI